VNTIATPLYQLVQFQHELEVLSDSGEIPPEQIAETLDALQGDIRDKAISVAQFTKNLDATADAVREAGKAMLARAERIEKRAESVRAYLTFQMQAAGISKIECPFFTLALRKNPPAVVIDDEAQIPSNYYVPPPPPVPKLDKVALKRAIQAGTDVPGVHLLQSERLEIRE
jgi:Siphovirus Gp157